MKDYDQGKDIEYFLNNQESLLEEYGNKFAVIHNQKVAEIFESDDKAHEFAVKKYGLGYFIVQELDPPEPEPMSYSFYAYP